MLTHATVNIAVVTIMCLCLAFIQKNGHLSSEKPLTLSPAVRRIQHILVSDQHCALEGEVDRGKKEEMA